MAFNPIVFTFFIALTFVFVYFQAFLYFLSYSPPPAFYYCFFSLYFILTSLLLIVFTLFSRYSFLYNLKYFLGYLYIFSFIHNSFSCLYRVTFSFLPSSSYHFVLILFPHFYLLHLVFFIPFPIFSYIRIFFFLTFHSYLSSSFLFFLN